MSGSIDDKVSSHPRSTQYGFVDIHSHILYGLDDGPETVAESLELLDRAAGSGTTEIVATPHANSRYPFRPELVDERIVELQAVSPITIHKGCDFRLQFDLINDALQNPTKYTINNRSYLLVEFPDLSGYSHVDDMLAGLVDRGMTPIITHPERNRQLQRQLDAIVRWVELGCFVQVTAASCTGQFGRDAGRCVDALMRRGVVHFVASDAHDVDHRPPALQPAFAVLAARWGEDAVRPLFVDNPRAVVEGEPLDVPVRPRGIRRRRWYEVWR